MLRAGKRQATKMKVGHTHRFRVGQDCLGLVRERGSIKRQNVSEAEDKRDIS